MILIRSIRPNRRAFSSSMLDLQPRSLTYTSSAAAIEADRTIRQGPRNDWKRDEIKSIYDSPLLDLLFHGVRTYIYYYHS